MGSYFVQNLYAFLVMERDCVYCAIRDEPLNTIQVEFSLEYRAMVHAVSLRSVTAEKTGM